jgi:pimeloyl-ACP methyl ester carboxylesterase
MVYYINSLSMVGGMMTEDNAVRLDMKQTAVEVDGFPVCVWTAGETGSDVVLIHGGGVDSAVLSWREAIPFQAQNHRVYAPDLPGYGGTPFRKGTGSLNYYISFLDELLQVLGLPRVHIAGISMGGSISLGYALKNPSRVASLVLVDSYGLTNRAPSHFLSWLTIKVPGLVNMSYAMMRKNRAMLRWSAKSLLGGQELLTEEMLDELAGAIADPRAALAFSEFQQDELKLSGLKTCYMERLHEIQAPTLIVHGSLDTLVPVKYAREAAGRIPGAQLEVMEGAGHWPMRARPGQFNLLLESFYSSLRI